MNKKNARAVSAARNITRLRVAIDRLNRRILDLLKQRSGLACRIGEAKRALRLPVSDPARERAILTALAAQARAPFDARGSRAVFSAIIRETKRIERGHVREQNAAPGQTHHR
ncbi:MAG: chorismate mutase [Fibrobacterota bacterium]